MPFSAEYFHRRAEECEQVAETITAPMIKAQFLDLAAQWRSLAWREEKRLAPVPGATGGTRRKA